MNPELIKAFSILVVGMITVFTVLGLVVLTGKILIHLVNRYTPDVVKTKKSLLAAANEEISKEKVAAMVAAVNILTQGKGKITNIKKVK